MQKDIGERIALKRYQLISPVLAEPARAQNEYFRKQAEREHDFPRYGLKRVSVSTMKTWLRMYRQRGFEALKPKSRCDSGRPRRVDEQTLKAIEVKCKAYPYWTVQKLYENLRDQGLLGDPPVHYNTLLRMVKEHRWLAVKARTDVRKAYEVDNVNDLWVCDFMRGPKVCAGNHAKRVITAVLCAIVDDHSRMIVGHGFNASETISALTVVLKEALLSYGIPKRLYVDNGPSFCSQLLFRTIRQRFLCGVSEGISLQELNEAFWRWLQQDYHHKMHTGIGERPIDRYDASVQRVPIRRLSKAELDEIFLIRHERVVNNDATISFKGSLYEVPAAYIRQRIEIRHPVDEPQQLFLYDNGVRVGRIKVVDKKENARTFRPKTIPTNLSFHNGRIKP